MKQLFIANKNKLLALIGAMIIACSDSTLEVGLKDLQDEGIVYAKVENASKYSIYFKTL